MTLAVIETTTFFFSYCEVTMSHETKCLFAHTEPGSSLPAYINVGHDARGVIVTVRGAGQQYGQAICLTEEQGRAMGQQILGEVAMKDLVSRFLTWPVPANVYPDGAPGKPGRTGTNLMTAEQCEQMLRHVLGVSPKAGPVPTQPR